MSELRQSRFTSRDSERPVGSWQWIEHVVDERFAPLPPLERVRMVGVPFAGVHIQAYATRNGVGDLRTMAFAQDDDTKFQEAFGRKGDGQLVESAARAVLSYSTNHFGHFVAETLGSIIHHARFLRAKEVPNDLCFSVLTPSGQWFRFLQKLCPGICLSCMAEQSLLEREVIFERAMVFPTLSPWQNLVLARNFLQHYHYTIPPDPQQPSRIHLFSPDQHRVLNQDVLQGWLNTHGFVTLDPCLIDPQELMLLLRDATLVISTQGSIAMNLLLARTGPTIMLGWFLPLLTPRQFSGGGVFNAVAHGLWHELPCRPVGLTKQAIKHPYSVPIEVPIGDLDRLFTQLIFS